MTRDRSPKDTAVRERAWCHAQAMGAFTYKDLAEAADISREAATALVRTWEARGSLRRRPDALGARIVFEVTGEADTPCAKGARRVRAATPQGNMWRAIRGLGAFTYRDVAMHANTSSVPVSEGAARDYCRMLANAGYLRVERKAQPKGRLAVYRLVRDTGPRPPRERRVRAVWDDNRGEYAYIAGGVA
jgi:hypothetical protein